MSNIFGAKKYFKLPSFSVLYSTSIGNFAVNFNITVGHRIAALLNIFRYRKANDEVTGSSTSKFIKGSPYLFSYYIFLFVFLKVILPLTVSPVTEKVTDSFVVEMVTRTLIE